MAGKKIVTSKEMIVKNARLAFFKGDNPEPFIQDGKVKGRPQRSYTLLLDPSNKEHAKSIAEIEAEGKRIAKEYFEDGVPKAMFTPGAKMTCYGYGNDLDKVYDGFADMFYVKLSNAYLSADDLVQLRKKYPDEKFDSKGSALAIIGRQRDSETGKFKMLKPGDDQWPYGGCIVNGKLTLWTQDSHQRKGINGNGIALQYVDKGQAFSGSSTNVEKDFEALEDSAETGANPFG